MIKGAQLIVFNTLLILYQKIKFETIIDVVDKMASLFGWYIYDVYDMLCSNIMTIG